MICKNILLVVLFPVLASSTCQNQKGTKGHTSSDKFCGHIYERNFKTTVPIIDDFLAQLKKENDQKNMDAFKQWLESHACVAEVEIGCVSCIETMPPQTEVRITFNINGSAVNKTMDISMGNPLKLHRYH